MNPQAPAFPGGYVTKRVSPGFGSPDSTITSIEGLTIRDYVAIQQMTGLIKNYPAIPLRSNDNPDQEYHETARKRMAQHAYLIADALIAESNKKSHE